MSLWNRKLSNILASSNYTLNANENFHFWPPNFLFSQSAKYTFKFLKLLLKHLSEENQLFFFFFFFFHPLFRGCLKGELQGKTLKNEQHLSKAFVCTFTCTLFKMQFKLAPVAEFLFGKCTFIYPPGQLFGFIGKFSQKANFKFSKMK